MKRLIGLFLVAYLFGCTSNSGDNITGTWHMHKVIQEGQDVSSEHNPQNDRYITLHSDQSFESGGKPYGKNTGKYEFHQNDSTLFLDSDVGPGDDSYWKVRLNEDTMFWQGVGTEWANDFQIIHVK